MEKGCQARARARSSGREEEGGAGPRRGHLSPKERVAVASQVYTDHSTHT